MDSRGYFNGLAYQVWELSFPTLKWGKSDGGGGGGIKVEGGNRWKTDIPAENQILSPRYWFS
jgi:hypothetical protein